MKWGRQVGLVIGIGSLSLFAHAADLPIKVVAAENFYGDIVQQIGGDHVSVTNILVNPNQDPHLFEASASTARSLSAAKLVIYNGAGYDPWMDQLLSVTKRKERAVIVVESFMHTSLGGNPHLWYDPATIPALAKVVAARLTSEDVLDKAQYDANLTKFLQSLKPLDQKIQSMRVRYSGVQVTATEPVFGYMAQAIGFTMRNRRFQVAVMNNTDPGPSAVAAFENDLTSRTVKILFYNRQVSDASVARMIRIAQDSKIPVIGITETEPANMHYQDWMMTQLQAIDTALIGAKP